MKTISVPLNALAMQRLDMDEAQPSDLAELILTNNQYADLSNSGAFEKINKTLGTLIDEYEDESIKGRKNLATTLAFFSDAFNSSHLEVFNDIVKLNKIAIEKETGIFFYF
ncbi:hypothetical protein [Pseudomonas sp. PSE1(2024)]|uniref:hypothetical protein n=1 Tax=Pseudomonas sp. PSE1(2024) TaxID=3228746 RepID=UPI003D96D1DC